MGYRRFFIIRIMFFLPAIPCLAGSTESDLANAVHAAQIIGNSVGSSTSSSSSCDGASLSPSVGNSTRFAASTAPDQLEISSLVSATGTLMAGWTESSDVGGLKCGFSTSEDGGLSWGTALVHRAQGFDTGANPAIASDSRGRLYALCMSVRGRFSSGQLEMAESDDHGKTWSTWRNVYSSNRGGPDKPALVADASGLHLILTELYDRGPADSAGDRALAGNVLTMDSPDFGMTWSRPIRISGDATLEKVDLTKNNVWGSQGASVVGDVRGDLFASWATYHGGPVVWVSRPKGSAQFSRPTKITDSDIDVPITQIASDPSGKHFVVLLNEAHAFGKVYWITSQDSGKSWSQKNLLTASGIMPAVQVDGSGRITFLWSTRDTASGAVKVEYAQSFDHGAHFSVPTVVGEGGFKDPSLIVLDYQSLAQLRDGSLKAFWIKLQDDDITAWQSTIFTPSDRH
jgi:hypothetical protein